MKTGKILGKITGGLLALSVIASGMGAAGFSETAFAAQETTIANPFIWADVPDEDIIRVGDTYYMVSTTMFFSPGAPIMKSKDLVSWEICNYVFDTYADGDVQNLANGKHDYSHGQWATSLRYKDGVFYAFFGSYGSGKSYIYKTTDIENGKWTRSELNGMYHDASMLLDDDGRNYLVYGGGGEIRVKELNSDMTGFKAGGAEQVIFKTGLDNLAGEGSHVQKIGDYYYVFIIAWPSSSGRIELCYRSKSILGPYEGKTVLNSGLGTYGSGVAQGGIVDTKDGNWYALLFQDHGSVGRIPVLVPVNWQDNWPVMGVNGKAPVSFTVNTDYTGTALAKDDDFSYSANKLALEWQWNHNPDNKAWSVTEREGYLRLHNEHIASTVMNARNTLTMRTEGPSCSSAIKLETKGMKPGDYAGLSAFQFNYGNVGVRVDDNGNKYIYMAKNGGYSGSAQVTDSRDNIIEQVPLTGDTAYLKAEFKYNNVDSSLNVSNNIDKADFYYSTNGSDWKKIGETLNMTYDLKLFTGYRSGIYSYPTKTTGGYADIDYFDYERADWNVPVVISPDADGYFFHDTFEGSTNGWSGRGPASVMTSGRTAYAGKEALLVSERQAAWNGASKKLSSAFKAGEEYSFSANVHFLDGGAADTFKLQLQYKDSSGEAQYVNIAKGTAAKGEWIQLANTNYKIPADASEIELYVETEDSTTSFYLDEVIGALGGTKIDGAGAGSAREIVKGDVNGDGKINIFDLCAAKTGAKSGFANKFDEISADVDESGTVDSADLVSIQKYIHGLITEFPKAEKPAEPPKQAMRTISEYTPVVAKSVSEFETADSKTEKAGVQYGTLLQKSYYSDFCKREKKYNVLLPAGYDKNKKYPVMYVLHGYWENQDRMIIKGNGTMYTKQIIGNAIAEGAAKDMIVVFPYVYSSQTQNDCSAMDDANNIAYDNFDTVLTTELIPLIEKEYSVATGRENTAITGFSMGGRESLNIGMKHPDMFGYVGAICPAPGASGAWKFASEEAAPSLIFITAGSNDTVVYTTPNGYHENFTKNNVPHIWHYVNGGYHGDNSIHAHLYNFVRAAFNA